MSSPDSNTRLDEADRQTLLQTAVQTIRSGMGRGPVTVDASAYSPALQRTGATFVTLEKNGELRGCIGNLEPTRPLIVDVAENAFSAAFRDSRFPPVSTEELEQIDVHISVLSPLVEIPITSEDDLLQVLRPGIDGLVIEEGQRRATFLPSVWETVPAPRDFLRHLKLKGGWTLDYWSEDIKASRYTVEAIP